MRVCPHCNASLEDNASFCAACGKQVVATYAGAGFVGNQPAQSPPAYQGNYTQPQYDPFDHTAEFDPKDISDNKVISMLVYLLGVVGVIVALLASTSSPYVAFHVRQALKFIVVNVLMSICAALLCWTVIVPVAYAVMLVVLQVVKIICFFQICKGQAKEPAIIRNLNFLK